MKTILGNKNHIKTQLCAGKSPSVNDEVVENSLLFFLKQLDNLRKYRKEGGREGKRERVKEKEREERMKEERLYDPLNKCKFFFSSQKSTHTHKKNWEIKSTRESPQTDEGHSQKYL